MHAHMHTYTHTHTQNVKEIMKTAMFQPSPTLHLRKISQQQWAWSYLPIELWKFCRCSCSPTQIGSFADVFQLSPKHPVLLTHEGLGSFGDNLKTSAKLRNTSMGQQNSRQRTKPSLVDFPSVMQHTKTKAASEPQKCIQRFRIFESTDMQSLHKPTKF